MRSSRSARATALLASVGLAVSCATSAEDDGSGPPTTTEASRSGVTLDPGGEPESGATASHGRPAPDAPAQPPDTTPWTPPDCYGNPWSGDTLSNYRVGHRGWAWSYRWTAPSDATVSGVRVYWIDNPSGHPDQGYAAGSGGTIDVALRPDDGNGFPDLAGPPLASAVKTFPTMVGGTLERRDTDDKREHLFGLIELSQPVPVSAGTTYHVTFRNTDPRAGENHVSLDLALVYGGERNPCLPPAAHWGVVQYHPDSSEPPEDFSGFEGNAVIPILEVHFTDRPPYGNGYLEFWTSAERPIEGTDRVRQVFEPRADQPALDVIGLRLIAVHDGGAVRVDLRDGDGELVERTEIAASAFGPGDGTWVEAPFPVRLREGVRYTIELSALDGAHLLARASLDGSAVWRFSPDTTWAEGWAQSSPDGGATWYGWHGNGATDLDLDQGDLALYLRPADP